MSKSRYWSGAHTRHRLMYHLVWIPKYRKRVLNGEIAERLKELFEQCASMNNWEIHELNIQKDIKYNGYNNRTVVLDTKLKPYNYSESSKYTFDMIF